LGEELQLEEAVLDSLVDRTEGLSGRDLHKVLCEQLLRSHRAGDTDPVASAMLAVRDIVVDRLDTAASHIQLAETQAEGLDRIIGYEQIKAELSRMVDQLLHPHPRMAELDIEPGNGVLLHGPPGNGKTSLAKALAAEYGLDFLLISGSQLQSAGGDGRGTIGAIDSLVQDAQRIAVTGNGLLLFFDEFDALAQAPLAAAFRSALIGNIDRIRRQGKIFLMAATNFHERLERAVIRPGRFDRHLFIDNPSDGVIRHLIRTWVEQPPFRLDCGEHELQELSLRWLERQASVSAVHTAVEIAKRRAIYEHGDAEELPVTFRDLLDASPDEVSP
jgi:SpoVK/Ycf46/Vps4 family AAA+-type ATPase